jgi:small-conductance mechanosensitive channel
MLNPQFYVAELDAGRSWLTANAFLLSVSTIGQMIVVIAAFLGARSIAPRAQVILERVTQGRRYEVQLRRIAAALAPLASPIAWLALLWLSVLMALQAELAHPVITIVVNLLTAWVAIRLSASLVRDPVWSRFLTLVVWTIAALNILGLLDPAMAMLDKAAVTLGGLRISALTLVKAMLSLAVLLWLAVFTGAVGVGIGFGLQKAVSNFISGLSILIDKSIKPGDVISLGDTYGWVSALGARYISVVTRDATEYLIPNDELITQQVINWSYSKAEVRLKLPVAISYSADVRQAIELCQVAASEVPRVLKEPKPVCLLKGFGDNGVNLELRIWINDPKNGVSNVKSDVFLRIWDKFHAQGIEIPFPQRDLHLKGPSEIHFVAREPEDRRLDTQARLHGAVMP